MALAISIGILLSIVSIALHSVSTSLLIHSLRRKPEALQRKFGDVRVFSLAAVWLLITHTLHSIVWAVAYMLVVGRPLFADMQDAVYFSAVTFSTLGYGDIVIEGRWKMLSACQAMTGLLIFGWSSALLYSVVSRVWAERFGPSPDSSNPNSSGNE